MHKIIIGIVFFITFQACVTIQATELEKNLVINKKNNVFQKIALLVGVQDYNGTENDLKGTSHDIEQMKELFEKESFQVKVLSDKNSLNILEQLNVYGRELSFQDSFIFYYSGHGSYKKDISGDEDDGQDEMIVLSDGNSNVKLLDDTLYTYFSKIKAKKLIIFDSCYSGTVSKSLNNKFQAKSIPPNLVTNSFPKLKNISELFTNSGEYIVLSSSQDDETSLSSKNGSLFTKYFCETFLEHKSESFTSLMNRVRQRILLFCKKKNLIPQHPKIEASNKGLDKKSFETYFK